MQAQSVDNQLWANYAVKRFVTEEFSYGGDVGLRGLISNRDWNQVLVRPTVSYKLSPIFGLSGAVASFNTFNTSQPNLHELRFHQEVTARWPDFGYVAFFYRFRLEQRTFFQKEKETTFNMRYRFLIGMDSEDIYLFGERPIYFQVIWEGFRTSGEEEVDEVFISNRRVHFAIGHRISDNFRYELHYINQGSRVAIGESFDTTQNVFRLRFYQRIAKE